MIARRVRRGALALAGAAVCAAVATGCGIRTTSVPVDAGAAPSRVPCSLSGKEVVTQSRPGVPVRIHLVCGSQLEVVERTTPVGEEQADKSARGRLGLAQVLIDELRAEPSDTEQEAGFTSSVKGSLTVSPGRKGDPAGTLRLSRQPEDLPPAALSQIVCTLAESTVVTVRGTVVLGGPGDYAPHGYACTPALKESPESAAPMVSVSPSAAP
ncbi:hypothetical protein [Streptomyces purpureus]|uniref:Lipoprotein n=1 Tax=Streptomyces purpureus TaxID=1951 RepID=A0A918LVB1_9ACTN|nr:hypothetical protein [Streptomyces purpureus]GGT57494.1 lipoprotein [Streptomyces purpureus]